jgi:hypothetical protein
VSLLGRLGTGCLRHGQFQIHNKHAAEARKTLEEAERFFLQSGRGPSFERACVRALLSSLADDASPAADAGGPSQRQHYADQAVTELRQFLNAGGKLSSDQLKKEPALQPIAGRADFQALVAERAAWEKAVQEIAEQMQRSLRLLRGGNHAGAVAELKPILASKAATAIDYYSSACVYSLASAAVRKDTKLSDQEQIHLGQEYASRAVELLRQAVDKGYRRPADVAHMRTDTDLDVLRQREDFRKLLTELEAANASAPVPGGSLLPR